MSSINKRAAAAQALPNSTRHRFRTVRPIRKLKVIKGILSVPELNSSLIYREFVTSAPGQSSANPRANPEARMKTANRNNLLAVGPVNELAIGWLTMFVVGSDLFVVSPLLPLIAADYGISPSLAGLSVTVFSLTYMLSAPILGHIADRIGRGRVLTYCLCAFSAANLLTAAAGNLTWLLAARLLAGAAAAGVSPSVYALVGSSAPPDRRATWLAIVVSGLLVSLSFGAPIGALTGARFGWPIVFVGLGTLGLLLVGANGLVWRGHDAPKTSAVPSGRLTMATVAPRLALTVVWSTAVYAMYTYLGGGLTSLGYSTEEIAEVIVLYGCGAISGVLIGGRMTDRLGAQLTSTIGLAGLCLWFFLLRPPPRAGLLVRGGVR